MQTKAALMVLVLLSGTIAGCTSDPDGGGNDGIDSDALDDLFDQYFEDFVNNTSITVVNHYHNNTTYVTNEYHNTTNNEGNQVTENNFNTDYTNYSLGQASNVSGSGEILFIMHLELNASEIAPELIPRVDIDPRTLVYNYTKNFTGYVWVESNNSNNGNNSNGSNGWYEEAWILITHQVPCSIFYHFENQYNQSYGLYQQTFWENPGNYYSYFGDTYGWISSHSTSDMMAEDYYQAGWESQDYCNPTWHHWIATNYVTEIGSIDIPEGYMISGSVIEYYHTYIYNSSEYNGWGDDILFERDSGQQSDGSIDNYGGWSDLTVDISLELYRLYESSEFTITILYGFIPVIPVE